MKHKLLRSVTVFVLILSMFSFMISPMGNQAQAAVGGYTISFNSNGVSGVSNLPKQFVAGAGQPCSIPSQKPTRPGGYVFQGYDTSSAAKTVRYRAGEGNVYFSKNTTLYPVWAAPSTYTISFSKNGKAVSNLPSNLTVGAGQYFSITSKKPTRTGCTFLGYDTSSAAKTVVYKAGQSKIPAQKNLTLYPVWQAKITVHDKDGGVHSYTEIEGNGKTLEKRGLAIWLPDGFHFVDSSGHNVPKTTIIHTNMELWVKGYTQKIDLYCGGQKVKTITVASGESIGQHYPELKYTKNKTTHHIIGWSTKDPDTSQFNETLYSPLCHLTFYADSDVAVKYYAASVADGGSVQYNIKFSSYELKFQKLIFEEQQKRVTDGKEDLETFELAATNAYGIVGLFAGAIPVVGFAISTACFTVSGMIQMKCIYAEGKYNKQDVSAIIAQLNTIIGHTQYDYYKEITAFANYDGTSAQAVLKEILNP